MYMSSETAREKVRSSGKAARFAPKEVNDHLPTKLRNAVKTSSGSAVMQLFVIPSSKFSVGCWTAGPLPYNSFEAARLYSTCIGQQVRTDDSNPLYMLYIIQYISS
jgi:hypothetical protein